MKDQVLSVYRVGVDIGGSHITSAVVDTRSGELISETLTRAYVDPLGNNEEIINAWTIAIDATRSKFLSGSIVPIGIAMPGPFDYENGISFITGLHKFESLYGLNVKKQLAGALRISPDTIDMNNDAICFLAGERLFYDQSFIAGLTLGTGLGSAIYHDKQYFAGDIYCMPFRDSRAEDYLCSRWFVSEYRSRAGRDIEGAKELSLSVGEDDIARTLFTEFGTTLAEVLVKRFDPDFPELIIVGGNISNAWDHFHPYAEQLLKPYKTSLVPARLGEHAAIIGAVSL